MGIVVAWDNPSLTIIRWEFDRNWAWSDVIRSCELMRLMIASVDHGPIDVIWDLKNVLALPAPLSFASNFPAEVMTETTGVILLTGANRYIRATVRALTTVNKSLGYTFGFVDTLEEAREMLAVP